MSISDREARWRETLLGISSLLVVRWIHGLLFWGVCMDFSKLYDMGAAGERTALHVTPRDDVDDPIAIYRGESRPQRPIVFDFMKGASGSIARDLVSTGLTPLLLISNRVVELLRDFTGWTTYPVELYGKNGELIPGYNGLAVTGRCGPIDDGQSKRRICAPPVPQGRWSRKWFGLYFDQDSWDGADIFVPEGTGITVVVERVKEAMERALVTNVLFRPLTECRNASIPAEFLSGDQPRDGGVGK